MLPLRVFFTRRTVLRAGRRNGSIPFVRWPEDLACHMRGIAASAGNASLPLSSRTPIRCLPPAVLPLARQEGRFFVYRQVAPHAEQEKGLSSCLFWRCTGEPLICRGRNCPPAKASLALSYLSLLLAAGGTYLGGLHAAVAGQEGQDNPSTRQAEIFSVAAGRGKGWGHDGCAHDCLRLVGKKDRK